METTGENNTTESTTEKPKIEAKTDRCMFVLYELKMSTSSSISHWAIISFQSAFFNNQSIKQSSFFLSFFLS